MAEPAHPASAPKPAPTSSPTSSLWHNPDFRAVVFQLVAITAVVVVAGVLVHNTIANLQSRGIHTGYGFLHHEAGFRIGETPIAYEASDSYGRALLVGILNTLHVSFLGILFATVVGVVVGIARLSRNWLIAGLASIYVETMRNVPLLLQLFFWYAVITGILPAVRDAIAIAPGFYLSKSGLMFPVPLAHPGWLATGLAAVAGVAAAFIYRRWATARLAATGGMPPRLLPMAAIMLGLPVATWLAVGAPMALDMPEMGRFRFVGGSSVSPEFLALLTGLTLYTAGFIAEIVRAGILAVPRGQTEAAAAIGLRRGQVLRLVVLPQALRVIVPPVTSQFLNLIKNSSLAVAIGYPDLVSITNTSLNQTGQAIECISIMMAVYLTISLAISAGMNLYNRRVSPVDR